MNPAYIFLVVAALPAFFIFVLIMAAFIREMLDL